MSYIQILFSLFHKCSRPKKVVLTFAPKPFQFTEKQRGKWDVMNHNLYSEQFQRFEPFQTFCNKFLLIYFDRNLHCHHPKGNHPCQAEEQRKSARVGKKTALKNHDQNKLTVEIFVCLIINCFNF